MLCSIEAGRQVSSEAAGCSVMVGYGQYWEKLGEIGDEMRLDTSN